MKKISVKLKESARAYDVSIENDSLKNCGDWAQKGFPLQTKKIVLISNKKVFGLYGKTVAASLEKRGFEVSAWLMPDGEKYKNFRVLEKAIRFVGEKKLKRSDGIIALGGGVVGDLAGFAAAIYLRGVAFLQIPTTFLAMIDSSVGGKTGVNTDFGKNLIGAFHQPNGVLIDVHTLKTLPRRELVAGFCEAVKHGAIASRELFDRTADFLENYQLNRFKNYYSDKNFIALLENLLAAQIAFKAEIVMQDEREDADRTDAKSRKILNFGHTVGHALEKATGYKVFKHGEAVGYGILVAAEIGKNAGIFNKDELNLLNDVLLRVGKLPDTSNINLERVFEAFSFDKKTIGKSLQWILLEEIGKPKIFPAEDLPKSVVKNALKRILQK
ncbi:MAG TPA: 3-dehydroquinate synthase [Pyrinomonadaceae bacterium]|nr:3-dehydroquinate synthase [Pyrinomonadaceae bacterium]